MKTKEISINDFISLINKRIKSTIEIFTNEQINFNQEIIDNIKKIYDKYRDENICLFFDEFTLMFCDLISIIYIR